MGNSSAIWDCKAAVEITKDLNGVGQVVLRNPQGASAQVSLHGAQVASWRNEHAQVFILSFHFAVIIRKKKKVFRASINV